LEALLKALQVAPLGTSPSADSSADIAREIQRRADLAGEDVSSMISDFVDQHVGSERQLTLRLARCRRHLGSSRRSRFPVEACSPLATARVGATHRNTKASCRAGFLGAESSNGLDAAVDAALEMGPASRALEGQPPDAVAAATASIRMALLPFAKGASVLLPAAIWIVTALEP
jgi:hypothetical protein